MGPDSKRNAATAVSATSTSSPPGPSTKSHRSEVLRRRPACLGDRPDQAHHEVQQVGPEVVERARAERRVVEPVVGERRGRLREQRELEPTHDGLHRAQRPFGEHLFREAEDTEVLGVGVDHGNRARGRSRVAQRACRVEVGSERDAGVHVLPGRQRPEAHVTPVARARADVDDVDLGMPRHLLRIPERHRDLVRCRGRFRRLPVRGADADDLDSRDRATRAGALAHPMPLMMPTRRVMSFRSRRFAPGRTARPSANASLRAGIPGSLALRSRLSALVASLRAARATLRCEPGYPARWHSAHVFSFVPARLAAWHRTDAVGSAPNRAAEVPCLNPRWPRSASASPGWRTSGR